MIPIQNKQELKTTEKFLQRGIHRQKVYERTQYPSYKFDHLLVMRARAQRLTSVLTVS